MFSIRSHTASFVMGFASGVLASNPEVKRIAKPLIRKAIREGFALKHKLEALAASAAEDLEDFVEEAKAAEEPVPASGATAPDESAATGEPWPSSSSTNGQGQMVAA